VHTDGMAEGPERPMPVEEIAISSNNKEEGSMLFALLLTGDSLKRSHKYYCHRCTTGIAKT
jgi:hypothetical protein